MRYLFLHNYRRLKKILLPNLLQIFFVLSIGVLTIVLSAFQYKTGLQSVQFEQYMPFFFGFSFIATHALTILFLKKNKNDLFFQQTVRKNKIINFIFRWRREINILLCFKSLLFGISLIIYSVIERYEFLLPLLFLLVFLYIISLTFLIQVNRITSIKKCIVFFLYYSIIFLYLFNRNNWLLTILVAITFVCYSICNYKETDYIKPLKSIHNIKTQKARSIKDYSEFIIVYIIRDKIYLELSLFSSIMTITPLLLYLSGHGNILIDNVNLIYQLWSFLIIEMCLLIGIGFSELVKLHPYFFIKNKFNTYTFTCYYCVISFIISCFFIIIPGVTIGYLTGFPIIEFPFTFIEVTCILLLSMYVSLFFPTTRKKTPMIVMLTVTVLWTLLKNFIVQKASGTPVLIFIIFIILVLLLFFSIIMEISNINKGRLIGNEH